MNTFTLERNNYRRKLISLVKQHPILWNKTQENYNRNRPQKMQAWQEISRKLDITVDKLRRTWENLRDQYRRDLKREVRYGFKSKWRFFSDMDFIRDMVSCKENDFKEVEFTDSDSELDVTHSPTRKQNLSTNIQTTTTPANNIVNCSSSSTFTTTNNCSDNFLNFQPIVLTKQWQPLNATICSYQHTSAAATEITTNCDSSKDLRNTPTNLPLPPPSNELAYETITKQESDLDLELERAAEVVLQVQEPCTVSRALENPRREFQEPCVSTSTPKRPRTSIEETSVTPTTSSQMSTARNVQVKIDPDLNNKDDDYYFVMSLLPSLRQIPRNRKFPLRISLMSLIAKELEEVCKE